MNAVSNLEQNLVTAQQRVNQELGNCQVPQSLLLAMQNERDTMSRLLAELHSHLDTTPQGSPFHQNGPFRRPGKTFANVGRAIEYGAGFGIGEDLINKLL